MKSENDIRFSRPRPARLMRQRTASLLDYYRYRYEYTTYENPRTVLQFSMKYSRNLE